MNPFFKDLYENVSSLLAGGENYLHQLEAREHTAQVESEQREDREDRFRRLSPERIVEGAVEKRGLPVLFCSPTMELGVDISTLNTVYMRNVPHTGQLRPEKRKGQEEAVSPRWWLPIARRNPPRPVLLRRPRHGRRSGEGPHDRPCERRPCEKPPPRAVWLAETGAKLGSSIRDVLNLEDREGLSLDESLLAQIKSPHVKLRAGERTSNSCHAGGFPHLGECIVVHPDMGRPYNQRSRPSLRQNPSAGSDPCIRPRQTR